MKQAIVIFGLGAPISKKGGLSTTLAKAGYGIKLLDPLKLCVNSEELSKIQKCDLVVGISLGGVWAPMLASRFPQAKLVLIASFPETVVQAKLIERIVFWLSKKWVILILNSGKLAKTEILVWIYKLINKVPRNSSSEIRQKYEDEMKANVEYFKNLSVVEVEAAVDKIKQMDNSQVLASLKNQTLVFAGRQDEFCPVEVAKRMHKKIKNSELVISNGGHYNVVGRGEIPILSEFLK